MDDINAYINDILIQNLFKFSDPLKIMVFYIIKFKWSLKLIGISLLQPKDTINRFVKKCYCDSVHWEDFPDPVFDKQYHSLFSLYYRIQAINLKVPTITQCDL